MGTASIRCEGCKSNFRGTTCPACGNWDQLLPREHQRWRGRKSRFQPKQQQQQQQQQHRTEGGGSPSVKRPPPQCTSCGHQPADDEAALAAEAYPSIGVHLTGVAPAGSEGAPVPVASDRPAAGAKEERPTAAAPNAAGGGEDGPDLAQTESNHDPTLGDSEPQGALGALRAENRPPLEIPSAESTTEGEKEEWGPPLPEAQAPMHGFDAVTCALSHDDGSSGRNHTSDASALVDDSLANDNTDDAAVDRGGARRDKGPGGGRSAFSTAAADKKGEATKAAGAVKRAAVGAEMPRSDRVDGAPPPRVGADDEDGVVPLPAAPPPPSDGIKAAASAAAEVEEAAESAATTRAAQPPPRSVSSKGRGGRRPFVRCRPSPGGVDPLRVTRASETDVGSGVMEVAEDGGDGGGSGSGGGRDGTGVVSAVALRAQPSGGDGDQDGDASTAALDGGGGGREVPRRQEERDRPPRRNRGAGRRRRRRRLGSHSSSSSPSSQSSTAVVPTGRESATATTAGSRGSIVEDAGVIPPPAGGAPFATDTAGRDKVAAAAAAAGTGRVTFAAVPRESSPPPPPGIRIGGHEEEGEEGGRRNARARRPGQGGQQQRQGQEMVHLAFCSRCQEYQSWRAPVKDAGCWRGRKQAVGGGGNGGANSARRNCTECGDLYCNVSYYPAR